MGDVVEISLTQRDYEDLIDFLGVAMSRYIDLGEENKFLADEYMDDREEVWLLKEKIQMMAKISWEKNNSKILF